MTVPGPTDLILIRHAPALNGGRLAGRRDVAADLPDADTFARLREALGPVDRLLTGPALRCQMTAAALFPGQRVAEDARLWEQDFGAWEGCPPGDLPDLGSLDRAALANHRPPGGESFADLCSRVAPALIAAASGGRVAVVAHAGTMRAALALALGDAAVAMAFEIAPLSTTLIRALPGGQWSVGHVNRTQA